MKRRLTIVVSFLLVLGASVCVAAGTIEEAYKLMAHGEYEQAIKVLDAILTKPATEEGKAVEPDRARQAETLFLLGRSHESLGRYDAALRAFGVVVEEYADSEVFANASLGLAELYVRANKPEDTAGALEAALKSGLSGAHQFRAELSLAEALSVPGTKVEDLERALDLLQTLEAKATRGPDIARVNYSLGFCYQQQNDWKNAESHYVSAMQAAPNTPWAAYALVRRMTYYRQQKFDQDATRLAKQLVRQQPLFSYTNMLGADAALPNAFNWNVRGLEEEAVEGEQPQAAVLQNAVFNYKGYRVWADTFMMNAREKMLQGNKNARLIHETDSTRTVIRGDAVTIDLKSLRATFTDNVSFEVTVKKPKAAPNTIDDLTELVIDLKTGRFRFRSAEQID